MKRSSLATVSDAMMAKASARKSETFRVFLLLFKPVAFDFLVSFVVLACQKRQSFQSSFQRSMLLPDKLRSAYQHEVERHEMGANFTLNHLR